ncbi:MAG: FAD-binding protein [Elusimicrobia bacterium]|nr:FAD-binding protein [Elusimicrobiota bacterium]
MSAPLGGLAAELAGDVLTGEADLAAYAYDGSLERRRPDGVVIAKTAEDVRKAVAWCAAQGVPYVARGAGTNLCGGCVPLRGGLVISLARLNRILAIDTAARRAVVEPGVVNLHLQDAAKPLGLFYAPDPASYKVCTLGGNIAENAGGPRCFKYGTTTNHVRAVEAVMPDGTLARFALDDPGPEIMSLLVGSEGTLGIVTKAWLDLVPIPERVVTILASFPSLDAAMACVAGLVAAGVTPRVLEAMDRMTVDSIEAYIPAGYPKAEAVLLIEVEGSPAGTERDLEAVREHCGRHGATEFRLARAEPERDRLWEGRRSAYAALARLAPNVAVEDGVVPRDRLPEAARRLRALAGHYKVEPALLFHAGDGNLHPNMIYDERNAEETGRVMAAGRDILRMCVELGGSISGEHGIGLEKRAAMAWLFSPESLALFRRVKDALDPQGLANPDKLIPLAGEGPPGPALERRVEPLSDAAQSLVARVREKARSGEELFVIGSGTKTAAALRRDGREVLTTRPLKSIRRLDRANLIAVAEAGITLAELKAAIEPEGFYVGLPLVPGTLGGLLAARPWPGIRDAVLAMRLLLPDGTVCEVGSPVVKSVAGYDLTRLLLGSWGTLAVILEVTLRLSARRPDVPNDVRAPRRAPMGPWHRKLKKAFDPRGLLNRWAEGADA